jgi:REP element-mobilizing transposase RayT
MYARRQIIGDQEFTHVFFRCHNREFLLAPFAVKLYFLLILAKYKLKYGIEIFEFNLMDNHIHMLLRPKTVEGLGCFMRTVNSLLARYINKTFNRDSQAIRERYKSPKIGTVKYLLRVIQYIWMNRYKETGRRPDQDPFSSASWRLDENIINRLTSDPKEQASLRGLLDSYDKLPLSIGSSVKHFVRSMIEKAIAEVKELTASIFEHGHTIADSDAISYRAELLSAFRREYIPWTPSPS